jgi:hypothetical protein
MCTLSRFHRTAGKSHRNTLPSRASRPIGNRVKSQGAKRLNNATPLANGSSEGYAYFVWHQLMGFFPDCRGINDDRTCARLWYSGHRKFA